MRRRDFLMSAPAGSLLLSPPEVFAASTKLPGDIHPPTSAFLSTLPKTMELASLPGIGIGIIRAGKPHWEHYAGVANTSTNTPITAKSIFPGCSLGKPV